ncbi:MAG: acyl-CoA thioesterase [Actinobacteria bacterium]|nr:acyl-CoA thioesterase [Actinomycetota bacterium]
MARFVHQVHMRWSDMDAYGHVNNGSYLAYLEQARVAMFFERYDGTFAQGTVISRHEIHYLLPIVYHPEPLILELWIDRIRGASFTVHYEVFDNGRLAARASTDCVTYEFATDRPRRLTSDERDILQRFVDDGREPLTVADQAVADQAVADRAVADRAVEGRP